MANEDLLYGTGDEDIEVLLDDEGGVPERNGPFIFDEASANLVFEFEASDEGRKILKKCAKQVCEDFDSAWDASEEYRQRQADNYKIYAGFLPPKEHPFKNCSNAHIPILLEGISRLSSRAYAELFLNNSDVYIFQPTGSADEGAAEILSKHTNWQIKNQITDFSRQMHRALVTFYTNGDVTAHSYFDTWKQRNVHEVLTCDEFVIPYVMVTTEPDYSDVPYKVQILRYHKLELERMRGEWANVDEVLERSRPSYDDEPEALLRESHAEVSGIVIPDADENAEYKLYQYDGYYKLPGSDEPRAIQAVVDPTTRTVMRLFIREEPDWQDQLRFERERREGQDFEQAMLMWEQDKAERDAFRMQLAGPGVDPFEYDAMTQGLDAEELPAPTPPLFMQEGKLAPDPPRMVAIEMYSHGVCMENFLGSLGLSYGQILADVNRALNNNINLFNDQASLSNASSYFMPDTFDIEPGGVNLQPGYINRVTGVDGNQIRQSIVEIKPGPANPQMVDSTRMLYDWGESAVAANEILSGEPGKSGETAQGQASRLEQALKQLSVSGHKFADFLVQLGRNNSRLNSMFLGDEEIFYVTDEYSQRGEDLRVGRQMYQRNYKVTIRADLRFASQAQRIAEADQMIALPNMVPPLQQNLAWWWGASAKALRARGMHDMLPLLGPRPPDPTTPMGVPPQPPPGMGPPPGQPPEQPQP